MSAKSGEAHFGVEVEFSPKNNQSLIPASVYNVSAFGALLLLNQLIQRLQFPCASVLAFATLAHRKETFTFLPLTQRAP